MGTSPKGPPHQLLFAAANRKQALVPSIFYMNTWTEEDVSGGGGINQGALPRWKSGTCTLKKKLKDAGYGKAVVRSSRPSAGRRDRQQQPVDEIRDLAIYVNSKRNWAVGEVWDEAWPDMSDNLQEIDKIISTEINRNWEDSASTLH